MKVKEVMTREVRGISPETNAKEALNLLQRLQISGLPVIDDKSRVVGMFTEKDILAYILPSYICQVGAFVYEENPKAVKKKFADLSRIKVSQIMRKEVVTLDENTTLCEAAKVMLTQKARRIPVLDKSGRITGIIARCDVLRAFCQEAGACPSDK
ncbi:MAG: CBS domain-containing protein [Candidatus Omnitrophica bacterium]|nr:CBS domain-containing protein [Candidatus Omnitrophota bacterium]